MKMKIWAGAVCAVLFVLAAQTAVAVSDAMKKEVYEAGTLKPIDSELRVKVGEQAPNFTLGSVSGKMVSLSDYREKSNVVISFIPAAWTPICSDQWPGYHAARDVFRKHNTVILGISVDNIPTLYAWTTQMGGLWFPVLSDFWPHGETAKKYGVLRSDGIAEMVVFIVDKKGRIRFIGLQDINVKPPLEEIIREIERIK